MYREKKEQRASAGKDAALFSESHNFAPEAAAGRLAVSTAPKEGIGTIPCSALATNNIRCLGEEYHSLKSVVHWGPGIRLNT